MDWTEFRNANGTIDLVRAFGVTYNVHPHEYLEGYPDLPAIAYLLDIQNNQGIVSRQAAAVAISTAWVIHSRLPL